MALLILRESNNTTRYTSKRPNPRHRPCFATPHPGNITTPRPNSSLTRQRGNITMPHPGNTLARYPDSTQAPRPSNTLALHRVNPAPRQIHPPLRIGPTTTQHRIRFNPRSASSPQYPSIASGGPPRSPETKNRSELQLFCDWQLLRTPQSRIAAQKRSKKWHISRLKEPRRAPNRKIVAKIPSFLFFVMGPIAATGQIPRKRAEHHDQQPKIRNKKGARHADASKKTNLAGIYASLAPYCS